MKDTKREFEFIKMVTLFTEHVYVGVSVHHNNTVITSESERELD